MRKHLSQDRSEPWIPYESKIPSDLHVGIDWPHEPTPRPGWDVLGRRLKCFGSWLPSPLPEQLRSKPHFSASVVGRSPLHRRPSHPPELSVVAPSVLRVGRVQEVVGPDHPVPPPHRKRGTTTRSDRHEARDHPNERRSQTDLSTTTGLPLIAQTVQHETVDLGVARSSESRWVGFFIYLLFF